MKVLVFGAGAVGSYLGGRLAQVGNAVTLVVRPTAAALLNSDGLFITENQQRSQIHVRAVTSLRQAFLDGRTYDVMLLTMKAYDVESAINEMAAFSPEPPPLITCQNGIGIEEMLAAEFPQATIVAGSVTVPLSMSASNSVLVEVSDSRGVALAPMSGSERIKPWVQMFKEAAIPVGRVKDYRSLKWSKALLNIMGNATSAIINRHPSAIYRYGPTFNLELDMLEEGLAVARASKIKIVDLPGPRISHLLKAMRWLPRALVKPVLQRVVSVGRGDKMPSFQIDLSSGKGKNEVLFHNVAIARQGRAVGRPAPINEALGDILMKLTRREVDWQIYNGKPDRLVADVRRYQKRMEK